jgi:Tol biopolymer transport system component
LFGSRSTAAALASVLIALSVGVATAAAPPGGLLVFASGRSILVVHPDRSGLKRVAVGADPSLSFDGRRVAFDRSGSVWSVSAGGGVARRLTTGIGPVWSSRGQIAFTRGRQIWAIDGLRRRAPRKLSGGVRARFPAWSADGRRLAFTGGDGLYVVRADGTRLVHLTTGTDLMPSWSPARAEIAFARANVGEEGIFVATADGRSERRVADGGRVFLRPVFAPKAPLIAFEQDQDIYIVTTDGSDLRRVTNTNPAVEENVAWAPDGALTLAFVRLSNAPVGSLVLSSPLEGSEATIARASGRVDWRAPAGG